MPHIFSIGGIVSQLMLAPKTVRDGKMSAEIGAGIPQPRVQGAAMNSETLSLWAPRVLSVLRIVAALIFLLHGTQKLLGFPPHPNPASITTLSWIAGLLELVGGPLLLVGLFTRPVAFLLAGEMAVAYWMAHAPRNLFPVLNGGDAAILYCFVFLYLVFAGPGPWSLDALMGRERGDAGARTGLFAGLRR